MPTPSNTAHKRGGTRYGGGVHGVPGKTVSWSMVEADTLRSSIAAVTEAGDAITFGLTSEGGAYYVGVLSEGLVERFYLDASPAAEECLRRLEAVAKAP